MKLFWPWLRHLAALTCTLLLVSACDNPQFSTTPDLEPTALLRLRFPTWQASGANQVQTVDLSAFADDKSKAAAASIQAQVSVLQLVKLDDTHAALLTQAAPVGDDNEALGCHACPGTVGAYFFEHTDAGWRLSAQQDAVANSGVEGRVGDTSVAKLAEGHYMMTAEWGSCWQGYCGTWLELVDIQNGRAKQLTPSVRLGVDNDGAHGACSALDSPTPEAPADQAPSECLDITSQWKFQGSKLVVHYAGRLSQLGKDKQLRPTQKVNQETVYDLAKGQLTLQSGNNPVPSF